MSTGRWTDDRQMIWMCKYFCNQHIWLILNVWTVKKGFFASTLVTRTRQSTCSAARGSRFSIDCAALLFRVVMAAANGVSPFLSRSVRSRLGCDSKREIITACWFSIAMWTGVFESMSCKSNRKLYTQYIVSSLKSKSHYQKAFVTICDIISKSLTDLSFISCTCWKKV